MARFSCSSLAQLNHKRHMLHWSLLDSIPWISPASQLRTDIALMQSSKNAVSWCWFFISAHPVHETFHYFNRFSSSFVCHASVDSEILCGNSLLKIWVGVKDWACLLSCAINCAFIHWWRGFLHFSIEWTLRPSQIPVKQFCLLWNKFTQNIALSRSSLSAGSYFSYLWLQSSQ